jgi:hypothetical protein
MKKIWLLLALLWSLPAAAQAPQQTPMGFCSLGSLASAVAITSTNCVFATFTGVVVGNTLTASSVTGNILPGQPLVGTGIAANTYIQAGITGAGGAGTYRLSAVITNVNSESMTTAGAPPYAAYALICASTQNINYRDDGVAPTATAGSGGQPIFSGNCIPYNATKRVYGVPVLQVIQFIQQTATAVIGISFYQ